MANTAPRPLPEKLPSKLEDWHRKIEAGRNLNDQVEDIHRALLEDDNQEYVALLYAVYDEQAVEGSLSADNIMAAEMIRDRAKNLGNIVLPREKLATISKALGVVLRRYGASRKERRQRVHGEQVPPDKD